MSGMSGTSATMLAPTPPMGWNPWNTFGMGIDERLIHETADAMVSEGLLAAGYRYLCLDDGWEAPERDGEGRLTGDTEKFPGGMKALGDYIHSKGLKFGIYSCAGLQTCQGLPASYGNEELDARTFADWGVDLLKYDYCYKPAGVDGPTLFRRMGQALRATGRRIVFSVCTWGATEPWTWAAGAGAHMWRTSGDMADSWETISKAGFGQAELACYAGPNRWNDPDMLAVGMYGRGNCSTHDGCTDDEYRSHFSLWCLLAAPLLIGCDVRNMTPVTREILTNAEAVAVDQDAAGIQARCLGADQYRNEAWAKPLADGSMAVGLFNRFRKKVEKPGDGERRVSVAWEAMGLHDRRPCLVRDLWAHEDLGVFTGSFSMKIGPHACALLKLTPQR